MKNYHEKHKVFVSSPFAGDVERNIDNARKYCSFAVEKGYIPYAPHLFFPQFMNDNDRAQRQLGIDMGKAFLDVCKEVWVFGDVISPGMTEEICYATDNHIPIRFFTESCVEVE